MCIILTSSTRGEKTLYIVSGEFIEQNITPFRMIKAVEKAFSLFGQGAYDMPNRFSCENGGVTSLYMPCYTEQVFGTKMLTLVPENRQRGLPSIDGVMLVNDHVTGETRALIDAKSLTAWRTGATGAMAVKHLVRSDVKRLGIVGCGTQGLYQAACICAVRDIESICLFDKFGVRDGFIEKLQAKVASQVKITVCADAAELVEQSDVIVTTTFSDTPVLPEDPELLKGRFYVAVGSYKPEMRELPDALFTAADRVYVDLPYACEESGDMLVPLRTGLIQPEQIRLIHTALDKGSMQETGETVVFKTVGMALVDLLAAEEVCRMAEEKKGSVNVAL